MLERLGADVAGRGGGRERLEAQQRALERDAWRLLLESEAVVLAALADDRGSPVNL